LKSLLFKPTKLFKVSLRIDFLIGSDFYFSIFILKHYQEQQKVAEKERQIIKNFKVKIQKKA
jgi:hypothetical protein